MSYMYGASVQGIQKFIFETNRLKEMIGASEIVEEICTQTYKDFIDMAEVEVVLAAAGNIKLKAASSACFEGLVRNFPRKVNERASNITISQAVVECSDDEREDMHALELKLKVQRNKQWAQVDFSALGVERSRRTGRSAIKREKSKSTREDIDSSTHTKITYSKESKLIQKLLEGASESDFSKNMEDMVSAQCGWLAVIHADGNALGKIIQKLGEKGLSIKAFSKKLDEITIGAARKAFAEVIQDEKEGEFYPIRPVVIGGDDLTVICRADLSLDFIKSYLSHFKSLGSEFNLSASAGISFVKVSYPFHYAIDLAEELCGESKKKTREEASVSFHKIQSSFTDSYTEIQDRELCAGGVSFSTGPYSLDELSELQKKVALLKKEGSPKSGIRKWFTELSENKASAAQLMDRVCALANQEFTAGLGLESLRENPRKTDLYHVLALASLKESRS